MPRTLRLTLCTSALAAWLLLLFTGHVLGGAVHVLLVVALLLFPWASVRRAAGSDASADRETGS